MNTEIKFNITLNTKPEEILKEFLEWADYGLPAPDDKVEDLFYEWWSSNSARFIDATLMVDE